MATSAPGRAWTRSLLLAVLVGGLSFGLVIGVLMGRGDRSGAAGASTTGDQQSILPATHNHDLQSAAATPDAPLDPLTRAQLAQQLTDARSVALRYPTVADARRAGYVPVGGFEPEVGAHLQKKSGANSVRPDGTVDTLNPGSLVYDGTDNRSRIVGLMYESFATKEPVGFAGPNDHWHRHDNICQRFTSSGVDILFALDSDVSRQQCRDAGGNFQAQSIWMLHAWVVPGWESPLGVFSHNNPDVLCADGTVNTDVRGFCRGT